MSPDEIEKIIKQELMDVVKKLVEDKLPKQIPAAAIDTGVKALEIELADVHIFKRP
jgi:hypothetical protein